MHFPDQAENSGGMPEEFGKSFPFFGVFFFQFGVAFFQSAMV